MKHFVFLILLTLSANVFGTIHADFSVDKSSGCSPLLVTFTSTSTTTIGHLSYRWDFANGNSPSALANPSAIFNTSGTYGVKLIVNNGTEVDSITKPVLVFRLPVLDFTADKTTVCDHDSLYLFSNVTPGNAPITDYAWGFGNGVSSSGVNTNYIYPQSGDYDITLVVQDSNHCTANLTKALYIHVTAKPHAEFIASPQYSCNSTQLINFTDNSTGNGLTYLWRLHDATTSTVQNPSYTYVQEVKTVTLIITNANGCVDSINHKVSAGELTADFSANKLHTCTGQPINFSNSSTLLGVSAWNFGDGLTDNTHSPAHVYTNPGVYTVSLIESYNNGACIDSITKVAYINVDPGFIPTISATNPLVGCTDTTTISFASSGPNGSSYVWNFGDGSTSVLQNPNHGFIDNGNYSVVVIVTDPATGCSVPISVPISITTHKPNTAFTADRTGCPGLPLAFHNASGSFSSFQYHWTFGDGDTSNLQNPVHRYSQAGTYTVTLKVTSGAGCDSTLTKPNYITVEDIVADFAVNQRFSLCPPFVAIFNSTVNKPVLKYSWDFGDGTTDTVANPTHIYFHPGIFTVRLAVRTTIGCVDTVVYPNLIQVQGPVGQFTITPSTGCLPLATSFVATISTNTKTIACDLGDGKLIKDSVTFNHTYTQEGEFTPRFILEDYVGCSVPYDLPPVITHTPPAPLNLRDTAICEGQTVNVALGTEHYKWIPSTYLSCDTCSNLSITPTVTTQYHVTTTNQYSCTITDTMTVTAVPLPALTTHTVKVCSNSPITLNAGNANNISWAPATYLDNATSAQPICTPVDTITYVATAFNSLGCAASAQVTVNVLHKLDITATGDITVCAEDVFQLQSNMDDEPDAGVHYNWTPASYFDNPNSANPTASNLQTETTFSVVATAQTCIPDTAYVTVHINALPDIHVSESVTTTPNAEVALWANSTQDLTYSWSAADSFSCITCRQTNLYPSQTQTVYVTGTNSFGCHVSDSVEIKVVACDPESVFMPNIFTPNGDGQNDVLFFKSKALASLNYFRLFDQWGSMVYQTKNIDDSWDGSVNGRPGAIAVYAYVMEGTCQNGGKVLKYGNISLIK